MKRESKDKYPNVIFDELFNNDLWRKKWFEKIVKASKGKLVIIGTPPRKEKPCPNQ